MTKLRLRCPFEHLQEQESSANSHPVIVELAEINNTSRLLPTTGRRYVRRRTLDGNLESSDIDIVTETIVASNIGVDNLRQRSSVDSLLVNDAENRIWTFKIFAPKVGSILWLMAFYLLETVHSKYKFATDSTSSYSADKKENKLKLKVGKVSLGKKNFKFQL